MGITSSMWHSFFLFVLCHWPSWAPADTGGTLGWQEGVWGREMNNVEDIRDVLTHTEIFPTLYLCFVR